MQNSIAFLPTFIPDSILAFPAFLTNPTRPSTTIIKRKGTKGSPFLNPLIDLNSSVGLPFTKIETEADSMHLLIHKIHLVWNPNLYSISYRKFHPTESYAFVTTKFSHNILFTTKLHSTYICNRHRNILLSPQIPLSTHTLFMYTLLKKHQIKINFRDKKIISCYVH